MWFDHAGVIVWSCDRSAAEIKKKNHVEGLVTDKMILGQVVLE